MARKIKLLDETDIDVGLNTIKFGFKEVDKKVKRIIIATTVAIAVLTVLVFILSAVGVFGEEMKRQFENNGVFNMFVLLLLLEPVLCGIGMLFIAAFDQKREKTYRRNFGRAVSEVAKGDYIVHHTEEDDMLDEATLESIDTIKVTLNAMTNSNEELAARYNALCTERDDYQFKMIGARMLPGMIERAITKIGRVAEARKINDIALFTESLSILMKSSLMTEKKPVPIADELSLIKRYLDLNDAITGKKTEYRMSVMCNIVGYKIIPHLILPVVENFFEYSQRGLNSRYELSVEINSSDSCIMVILRDNGSGIDVDELEKVQNEISENEVDANGDALSLSSINRRIGLCYGEKYGIKVTSSKLGTNVRIILPAKPDVLRSEY